MQWQKAVQCFSLEDYFEAFVVLIDAFELTLLESSHELESNLMSWKAMMNFDESEMTKSQVCTSNELK